MATFSSNMSMVYDALGRRVEQTVSGSTTEILYGADGSKLALMSGQSVAKAFIPLTGGATAVYNGGTLAWYRHADWLGSSRIASAPTGSSRVVYDEAYSPFGEDTGHYSYNGGSDPNFTGQNQDLNGLFFDFPAREYQPWWGRWISPDPAGLAAADPTQPQSWNRYAYVMNDPLTNVDPDGLDDRIIRDENGAIISIILDPNNPVTIVIRDPGGTGGSTDKGKKPLPKPTSVPGIMENCLNQTIKDKGVSIALDVLGAIPGLGNVVSGTRAVAPRFLTTLRRSPIWAWLPTSCW